MKSHHQKTPQSIFFCKPVFSRRLAILELIFFISLGAIAISSRRSPGATLIGTLKVPHFLELSWLLSSLFVFLSFIYPVCAVQHSSEREWNRYPLPANKELSFTRTKGRHNKRMEFPRTFVINLSSRADRLEGIRRSFSDWPVPIERFEAHRAQPGWKGCLRSHKSLLERCRSGGCDYAIILEDDCILTQKGKDIFMQVLPLLKRRTHEWDVFMGGVTYVDDAEVKLQTPPLFEVRSYASHFCFFNSQGMREVVSKLSEEEPYDVFLKKHLRVWCTFPHIAIQKEGHSDIQDRYVDSAELFQTSHNTLEKVFQTSLKTTLPARRSSDSIGVIQLILFVSIVTIAVASIWRVGKQRTSPQLLARYVHPY